MSPLPDPLVNGAAIADIPQWTLDLLVALGGAPDGLLYDTGLVDITLRSGYTGGGGASDPQVRRISSILYFRGLISGPFAVNTAATVADLPPGFTGANSARTAVSTGAYICYANLNPSGAISFMFRSPFAGSSAVVSLAGMSGITTN